MEKTKDYNIRSMPTNWEYGNEMCILKDPNKEIKKLKYFCKEIISFQLYQISKEHITFINLRFWWKLSFQNSCKKKVQ